MMHRLLAKMDENQAKADDNQAKADANHETMLAEIKADRKAHRKDHEEMMATIRAGRQKDNEAEAMACEEKTEVRLGETEEPASVDVTPEVADEEVPVQDAARMPVGEPRKKRRDRYLAAVRRQKKQDQNLEARRRGKEQGRAQRRYGCLKNLVAARRGATRRAAGVRHRILSTKDNTLDHCGPRKGRVAAHRGTTCRAVMTRRRILLIETTRSRRIVAAREVSRRATVARRRRDATKKERDDARRAPRERTPGKRRRANLQGNTATKASDARRRLRLRDAETAGRLRWENHGNVIGPKIAKRTTRPSARMRTTKDWTLWRGRPPSEAQEVTE
jgi:hypothetical protein